MPDMDGNAAAQTARRRRVRRSIALFVVLVLVAVAYLLLAPFWVVPLPSARLTIGGVPVPADVGCWSRGDEDALVLFVSKRGYEDMYSVDCRRGVVYENASSQSAAGAGWLRFLKHGPWHGVRLGSEKTLYEADLAIRPDTVCFRDLDGELVQISGIGRWLSHIHAEGRPPR